MKSFHLLRRLGLAGLFSTLAASALAQEAGYFYGGASLGQSRARIDDQRITAGLLGAGLVTTAMTQDERGNAYKLFGGYQFTRQFGLEAGYFDLGRFGFTSTTAPAGTLDGQIRVQGLNLDLVGTLPLSERWSALGRIGAQYARSRDRFSGTGAVGVLNPNPGARQTHYKLGLGLQYEIGPAMLLRGEIEHYRVNDAVGNHGGVNVASLSLVFPFGRSASASPRAMAQPVYVAQAPVPVPAPVATLLVPQVVSVAPMVIAAP